MLFRSNQISVRSGGKPDILPRLVPTASSKQASLNAVHCSTYRARRPSARIAPAGQLPAQPEPPPSNPDGKLIRPPSPRLTPWAHRSLPRAPPRQPVEDTPRRARGPPVDYGDKPAAAKWSLFTPPHWSLFAPPLTATRRAYAPWSPSGKGTKTQGVDRKSVV